MRERPARRRAGRLDRRRPTPTLQSRRSRAHRLSRRLIFRPNSSSPSPSRRQPDRWPRRGSNPPHRSRSDRRRRRHRRARPRRPSRRPLRRRLRRCCPLRDLPPPPRRHGRQARQRPHRRRHVRLRLPRRPDPRRRRFFPVRSNVRVRQNPRRNAPPGGRPPLIRTARPRRDHLRRALPRRPCVRRRLDSRDRRVGPSRHSRHGQPRRVLPRRLSRLPPRRRKRSIRSKKRWRVCLDAPNRNKEKGRCPGQRPFRLSESVFQISASIKRLVLTLDQSSR